MPFPAGTGSRVSVCDKCAFLALSMATLKSQKFAREIGEICGTAMGQFIRHMTYTDIVGCPKWCYL